MVFSNMFGYKYIFFVLAIFYYNINDSVNMIIFK